MRVPLKLMWIIKYGCFRLNPNTLYLAAGSSPLISTASVSFDADCCYELHHAPEFHAVR